MTALMKMDRINVTGFRIQNQSFRFIMKKYLELKTGFADAKSKASIRKTTSSATFACKGGRE